MPTTTRLSGAVTAMRWEMAVTATMATTLTMAMTVCVFEPGQRGAAGRLGGSGKKPLVRAA
jgi:hypothetical protein